MSKTELKRNNRIGKKKRNKTNLKSYSKKRIDQKLLDQKKYKDSKSNCKIGKRKKSKTDLKSNNKTKKRKRSKIE